jgi:hypothetical protein
MYCENHEIDIENHVFLVTHGPGINIGYLFDMHCYYQLSIRTLVMEKIHVM